MTQRILSLAAAALLSSITLSAQLTSSPLEPGLYNQMQFDGAHVTLIDDSTMRYWDVTIQWESSEQITLSAEIAQLQPTTDAVEARIADYNVGGAVGTLRIEERSGTILLEHHLNPRLSNTAQIASAVEYFESNARRLSASFSDMFTGR